MSKRPTLAAIQYLPTPPPSPDTKKKNASCSTSTPSSSPSSSSLSPPPFFTHNNLDMLDLEACTHLANTRFPGSNAYALPNQGHCSYTLLIKPNNDPTTTTITNSIQPPKSNRSKREQKCPACRSKILQFRPERFALNLRAIKLAKRVHGELVSSVGGLGVMRPPAFGLWDDLGEEGSGRGIEREDEGSAIGENNNHNNNNNNRSNFLSLKNNIKELLVYEMDLLPGICYAEIQPHHRCLDGPEEQRLVCCLEGMAKFFAQSWHSAMLPTWQLNEVAGTVGSSILTRLQRLGLELPSDELRNAAREVAERVGEGGMDPMPRVLAHGDILPSNLLVDAETGCLTGVVDWAEAEALPFGVALYGIERLLGWVQRPGEQDQPVHGQRADSVHSIHEEQVIGEQQQQQQRQVRNEEKATAETANFQYVFYQGANRLRRHFYSELEKLVPDLGTSKVKEAMALSRKVGILLWFGFAWDDGRIDRVVDNLHDPVEVSLLQALLAIEI